MEIQTLNEFKTAGYPGAPEELIKDLLYLEQLASATQVDISGWPKDVLLGVKVGDKRAINKVFFDYQQKETKQAELTPEQKEALEKARQTFETSLNARVVELDNLAHHATRQAQAYADHFRNKLAEATQYTREAQALKGEDTKKKFTDCVQKIITGSFWKFESATSDRIKFSTKPSIILTEVNKKLGIHRRIDLGRFKAVLYPQGSSIRVEKHSGNTTLSSGYYHPYIDTVGEICWGTASATAAEYLREGHYDKVMDLLATLLTTYSPDTTPWRTLYDFDHHLNGDKAAEYPICDDCQNPQDECDCSYCETCERREDDCMCSYCEACDVRYNPENDHCGGLYCERCDGCTGPEHCETHYCYVCGEYSRDRSGVCSDGCCLDCDRTDDNCVRCRDCDEHEGHDPNCSANEQNQEEAST